MASVPPAPPPPFPSTAVGPNGTVVAGPPTAVAAKALLAKLNDSVKHAIAQQRPWQEMADRTAFLRPENMNDAVGRVRKNVVYFRANYALVLGAMVMLCMLANPMSILVLVALILMWGYIFMVRAEPIVVMGRTLNDREKFLASVVITVLVTFGLTSVGSIVVSGLIFGTAAVVAHSAFRVPDDLFLDDQVTDGGFLSFLGPGQQSNQLPTSIGQV